MRSSKLHQVWDPHPTWGSLSGGGERETPLSLLSWLVEKPRHVPPTKCKRAAPNAHKGPLRVRQPCQAFGRLLAAKACIKTGPPCVSCTQSEKVSSTATPCWPDGTCQLQIILLEEWHGQRQPKGHRCYAKIQKTQRPVNANRKVSLYVLLFVMAFTFKCKTKPMAAAASWIPCPSTPCGEEPNRWFGGVLFTLLLSGEGINLRSMSSRLGLAGRLPLLRCSMPQLHAFPAGTCLWRPTK